jgi:NAD(P)-dependent dehydrogenase (short-subunit alcohol dehydrogenase family)
VERLSSLFDIAGKAALVTGGNSGIGLMIASGFVEAGVRTYLTARNAELCDQEAARLSKVGTCLSLPGDVSSEEGCADIARRLTELEPVLHILVNNAAAHLVAPIEEHSDAIWDEVIGVNLKGLFHLTRFLLPQLRAASTPTDPARVINLGSIDAINVPSVDEYSYAASKAAVHHLTKMMAKRFAPDVTVNVIAPGPFLSKMTEVIIGQYSDVIIDATPLRRIGRPDDMAGAAIYLASRAGSYLTGAMVPVDGGLATTCGLTL